VLSSWRRHFREGHGTRLDFDTGMSDELPQVLTNCRKPVDGDRSVVLPAKQETGRTSYCRVTTTTIKVPGLAVGRPVAPGLGSSNSAVAKYTL
jgi:hypothetical protein